MRINKLFHWLYFVLMSLPIFAIGVTCLTCFWNKDIVADTQTVEITYKYTTNEVNSISDLVVGNTYQVTVNSTDDATKRIYCSGIITTSKDNEILIFDDVYYVRIDNSYAYVYSISTGTLMSLITYDNGELTIGCTFSRYSLADTTIDLNRFGEYTGTNIIENVDITSTPQDADVKNIFYYAVDKVSTSSLFTWAQASFLGVPVSYLGGIFGLASNSVINVLLCYWVAISIIWLMFDVLMFVPMLVHKSIDKARF